ncbi:hypothetical protein PROVRETT_10092 [Providencia rettgeri DSM 1131]|nr:hypothetical protein PROVRETT_10092 [Providencia rettgeri DSM 1131]
MIWPIASVSFFSFRSILRSCQTPEKEAVSETVYPLVSLVYLFFAIIPFTE